MKKRILCDFATSQMMSFFDEFRSVALGWSKIQHFLQASEAL
jgi:hypothetical protein